MTASYVVIEESPTWWQVLLLTVAGGVIALLARDGWEWLVDWWSRRRRNPGPTGDTTADDPSRRDHDALWRGQGKIPAVPDLPTHYTAPWWKTKRQIHRAGCPTLYRYGGIVLHDVHTLEAARARADQLGLTAARCCNPLDEPANTQAALTPEDVTA
ncbi:MAG: hypothetical protein ACRD0W_05800 [Acidimicrobiales bacterium]